MIDGYNEPYCFDINKNDGGVFIYVREDIPINLLADNKLAHDIEGILFELILRKKEVITFWVVPSPKPIR